MYQESKYVIITKDSELNTSSYICQGSLTLIKLGFLTAVFSERGVNLPSPPPHISRRNNLIICFFVTRKCEKVQKIDEN